MPRINLYKSIKAGLIKVPYRGAPLEWRFWNGVDKDGPEHPTLGKCWVWTGCTTANGYGVINVKGQLVYVHCYSYQLHVGPITNKLHILHLCDNPPCTNPAHLQLGTHLDNVKDMIEKGRQARGERAGLAKLTDSIVREARRRYRRGDKINGVVGLAREFGVSQGVMCEAIQGKTWKHIT